MGAVAAVAVLAMVSVLAWVWRHPTAFPEVAPGVSTGNDRWPVGQDLGICTLRPQPRSAIGSGRAADISEECETWVSIDDQRLTSDAEPGQQLLMKVAPRQRGIVEVAGAVVTYSHGWQRGSQTIGEHLRLNVR